ncbi:MAG: RDD family protein [Firmicutes bacterium]|nr:RDD family protein [Bacillota bacterium]
MTETNYSYPKATVGKRILAYLIDAFIITVPVAVIIPLSIVPFFGYVRYDDNMSSAPNVVMIILMVLAIIVVIGWAIFYSLIRDGFGAGQSWGKKICGLMVVNLNTNEPCNKVQSLVRNVFALLISVGLSWVPVINGLSSLVEPIVALVHEKGQRVGDMVGNTQVIDLELYDSYPVT